MADELHQRVLEALGEVRYPGFSRDVVSLGTVKSVAAVDGVVTIEIALPPGAGVARAELEKELAAAARRVEGVREARVVQAGAVRSLPVAGAAPAAAEPARAEGPRARNIVGVASGKGGVGKSTVAVNLAVELARRGRRVGFLDADVHGPSAPLMFGLEGRRPEKMTDDGRPEPLEAHGVLVMSMGFFVERGNAVIWRGPIVGNFIRQLLTEVAWGELDDLIIDFPPGTGDAQLTISQTLRMTGSLVVSTPNDLALIDALKAIAMFRKVEVPILGLVENMAYFACPHCQERTEIFGPSSLERVAREHDVPLVGRIPIDPQVVADSDHGSPVAAGRPDSAPAAAYRDIADAVLASLDASPAAEQSGLGGFLQRFSRR